MAQQHEVEQQTQSTQVTVVTDNGRRVVEEHTLAPSLVLDQFTFHPEVVQFGNVTLREGIKSTVGPFHVASEYQTQYPAVVVEAIGNLYQEYNTAFTPLVDQNREWDTDYQFCRQPNGMPNNRWVQIDMVGLPEGFLQATAQMGEPAVREILRGRIFELENSLAMYQLLENIFAQAGQDSRFKQQFTRSLDALRREYGRPIALLAVTDQKYQAMRESEFGKIAGEELTDAEVKELSGFDKLFGPTEFMKYIKDCERRGIECEYLLYARTSEPVAKLRRPDTVVEVPLLEDDQLRKIIKAYTVTFNIDRRDLTLDSPARINDTKAYMPAVGMGYPITSDEDLRSAQFRAYLVAQGVSPEKIESGEVAVHAKPMYASYGAYGHHHAELASRKLRDDIRAGIRKRGPYIVQPEMKMPVVIDQETGQAYAYIDRNFFSIIEGKPVFMGGFRSLMPLDSTEYSRGRIHGNGSTVWAEIY